MQDFSLSDYTLVCSALAVPSITPTTSIGLPSLVLQQACAINILIMPRERRRIIIMKDKYTGFLREFVIQQ